MSDRFKKPSGLRNLRGNRGSGVSAPRRSRRQQEAMYQRLFYVGLIGAAALILIVLGAGAFYEYQIKPNQVLATVNGEEITREEYWKYQNVTLYNQARLYEDYALQVTGQQQTQFLMYAAQFDQMREDVWGSTDVSEATIQQMVEDRLYVAGADEMGVDLSQPVLEEFALNSFAPADAPLLTPEPTPTMIPTRAAWATETQQALETQQAEMEAMAGTPPGGIATPVGTPAAAQATPVASPDLAGSRSTASAGFELFKEEVLDDARLSYDDYLEMIIKPQVARTGIDSQLVNAVPQSAAQANVQHILVQTEDLANATHEQITSGADFDEVAKTTSTDTVSAPTGGQLGWIIPEQMPDEFAEAVFSAEPGQVVGPVQTSYGWHIIKVLDRTDDRPLTETQYSLAKNEALDSWIAEQREVADISSDHYNPAEEQTPEQFYPPADAPTPVIATPVPAVDTSLTPVAGPQLPPAASPAASPVSGPGGTPGATPEA